MGIRKILTFRIKVPRFGILTPRVVFWQKSQLQLSVKIKFKAWKKLLQNTQSKRITELLTPRRRSARLTERLNNQSQSDSEQDLPSPKVETDQSRPAENTEKFVLPVDHIDYPI